MTKYQKLFKKKKKKGKRERIEKNRAGIPRAQEPPVLPPNSPLGCFRVKRLSA